MKLQSLSLRDLEAFVMLSDILHFGKAAKKMHITQPALSHIIQKIEGLLEVDLFERDRKKVGLTSTGHQAATIAKEILRKCETLLTFHEKEKTPLVGTFRLGVIATIGPYWVPLFLPTLRKKYPKIEIYIQEGMTDILLNELDRQELDAVIAADSFEDARFNIEVFAEERFWLIAPRGHPILEKAKIVGSDLDPEDMVLLKDGHCLKDQTLEWCPKRLRGHEPKVQATGLEILKCLVGAGFGDSVVPERGREVPTPLKSLVESRPFADTQIGRKIVYVKRASDGSKDVKALQTFLKDFFRKEA